MVGQPEIQIFAMPLPDGRRGCFPKMWQTKRPHAAKMWQTKRPHATQKCGKQGVPMPQGYHGRYLEIYEIDGIKEELAKNLIML